MTNMYFTPVGRVGWGSYEPPNPLLKATIIKVKILVELRLSNSGFQIRL